LSIKGAAEGIEPVKLESITRITKLHDLFCSLAFFTIWASIVILSKPGSLIII